MESRVYWERISTNLKLIYSAQESVVALQHMKQLVNHTDPNSNTKTKKTSASSCLITYASTFTKRGVKPLQALSEFITNYRLNTVFEVMHILPFYPWDTDRGFSVCDFYSVDPEYGNWEDIGSLATSIDLMFDFVANHASIQNPMVQSALIANHLPESDPRYSQYAKFRDFVITYTPETKPSDEQLAQLTRPRPTPVLSHYTVVDTDSKLFAYLGDAHTEDKDAVIGSGFVWTTFSRPKNASGQEETRQVDLNFSNPAVLIEALTIMLFYYAKGASWIRLDAIGYIWKKIGSSSLHEPQAHIIIQIISDFFAVAADKLVTVSEVNEPQEKAVEYLGTDQSPEADLFYQFSHFPLAVYGFATGDTQPYKAWLKDLPNVAGRQFVTVLGSHDGMGLKPVRRYLTDSQREKLIALLVRDHGALPNYSMLPGGDKIVYELCATPWNLINKTGTDATNQNELNKYLSVVALGLLQRGTPAIYINGLLGATNYLPTQGLDENRTINRQIFDLDALTSEIGQQSHIGIVLANMIKLFNLRKLAKYFSSTGPSPKLIESSPTTICILLDNPGNAKLVSVTNFSNEPGDVVLDQALLGQASKYIDLITGASIPFAHNKLTVQLGPYQTKWAVVA